MKNKINILSTMYTIKYEKLSDAAGFCDPTSKTITISTDNNEALGDFNFFQNKVLRHEIIHAFMNESGLCENWEHRGFGQEETIVDWFAIQSPKIYKVYKELKII